MKNFLSMMAIAAMTACALVSCGSDDDDSPKGTSSTSKPKTVTVENNGKKVSFKMMPVEAGTFTMGATEEQQSPESDEKPAHSVTITDDYYMGETEVTQELWEAVMGNNPSKFSGSTNPVEQVSWDDCQEFIKKLNTLTGEQFRMPTEAEWEFAARGGNKSKGYQYSGSDNLDDVAWYGENWKTGSTHPVKKKASSELGIYDMSGNVWEWCLDWYGSSYSSSLQTNPTGPATGSCRVIRGGSWDDNAKACRLSRRGNIEPEDGANFLGLRLVL